MRDRIAINVVISINRRAPFGVFMNVVFGTFVRMKKEKTKAGILTPLLGTI